MSVTLRLADDLDISRGDLIGRPTDRPSLERELDADVCWMADAPLRPRGRYLIKHAAHTVAVMVDELATASTSTRSTARTRRPSWPSTTSAASACARRGPSRSTPTRAIARRAASSSSTRRRTRRLAPG